MYVVVRLRLFVDCILRECVDLDGGLFKKPMGFLGVTNSLGVGMLVSLSMGYRVGAPRYPLSLRGSTILSVSCTFRS